jgi:hypothetical protein
LITGRRFFLLKATSLAAGSPVDKYYDFVKYAMVWAVGWFEGVENGNFL